MDRINRHRSAARYWGPGAALFAIIIANVVGSLYWVQRNFVLVGHDASAYLGTSLEYARFLTAINPQTLFQAFTYPYYRAPALFIAVQPFFRLFGADMDSAQLLNVLLLAPVIWLTYLLGREVADRRTGLFAALLIGLLPMIAAMARLFYTELFLTVMVALNLYALYRARAFAERNWSIIWGVSLGVGLLVKWTMPIYVLLPLLWEVWRSDLLRFGVKHPRRIQIDARSGLAAVVTGLAIAAIWFWPNRDQAQLYPLGNYLYIGWALLIGGAVYGALLPRSRASNLVVALFAAAAIASLWYLPHITFAARLLQTDQARGQASPSPFRLENYLHYGRYLYQYHFGALAFWLIVPVAALPWLRSLWLRRSLNSRATLLWLSLLSAILVLTLLSQRNPRNLVPLLPALAVLAAVGLKAYPRRIGVALGLLWVTVLVIQWGLFTVDRYADLQVQTRRLWVRKDYLTQPRSHGTDLGYWIGPEILARVTEGSDDLQGLGILVNSHQIHRGIFRYLIARDALNVEVQSLTEEDSDGWYDLLSTQWLLLKDGNNHNVEAPGQALLTRIAAGDPLFDLFYREIDSYELPDGDTVRLFHRAQGPAWPHAAPEILAATRNVADAIQDARSEYAQLIYGTPDLAIWVGIHDPGADDMIVLQTEADAADKIAGLDGTLLVVLSHEMSVLQDWLDTHAYRTYEVGDDFAALAIYGRPSEALVEVAVDAAWPDLSLTSLRMDPLVAPGQVLPLAITVDGSFDRGLKVSGRLQAPDGTVLASHDRVLAPADRFGLFVPPDTPPGTYDVVAIVYDPATMEQVPDVNGAEVVVLTTVRVQE